MKYLAVTALAVRHSLSARGAILARCGFYVVLLVVFSQLWKAVDLKRFSPVALLWYLALTEWLTLGTPLLYMDIEEDVRRGDIAYRIARPASYLWMRLAESAGDLLVRLLFLAVVGFSCAWLFSGSLPADPRGLLLAVPLVFLATLVLLMMQAAVGLSAFWLQDASPVYWIWQKLMFVFGGLLFPLDIYPSWLRAIAMWTPFEPLVYGCGRMAFGYDPAAALEVGLKIVGWGVLFGAFLAWLYARGLRILNVNGG